MRQVCRARAASTTHASRLLTPQHASPRPIGDDRPCRLNVRRFARVVLLPGVTLSPRTSSAATLSRRAEPIVGESRAPAYRGRIAILVPDSQLAIRIASRLVASELTVEILAADARPHGSSLIDVLIADLSLLSPLHSALPQSPRAAVVIALCFGDDDVTTALALHHGVDECLLLPMPARAIASRVRAALARTTPEQNSSRGDWHIERFGDVDVHFASHVVTRAGRRVDLTPLEYEMLLALLGRNGAAVTRAALMREVGCRVATPQSRLVDTVMCGLRRKLEIDHARPRHLLTVRGFGFRLRR